MGEEDTIRIGSAEGKRADGLLEARDIGTCNNFFSSASSPATREIRRRGGGFS